MDMANIQHIGIPAELAQFEDTMWRIHVFAKENHALFSGALFALLISENGEFSPIYSEADLLVKKIWVKDGQQIHHLENPKNRLKTFSAKNPFRGFQV